MFQKISKTQNKPPKPLMIWDGECGFCKYWIIVWNQKSENIEFNTFQEVADHYPEIPLKEFKKASRFIDTDGHIYSGPDSAYMSLAQFNKPITFLHHWYEKYPWFRWISDHAYNEIAKNRPIMMTLTIAFWGNDPLNRKPYWAAWLLGLISVFYLLNLLF
jgi:predicted DCC family thiol-disulfide oxidoreductase YuxK